MVDRRDHVIPTLPWILGVLGYDVSINHRGELFNCPGKRCKVLAEALQLRMPPFVLLSQLRRHQERVQKSREADMACQ